MHGIVFAELQKFVVSEHGHPGWKAVADKAGMAHKVYLSAGQYPDSEITSLVTAVLYTQGETGMAGALEPIETTDLGGTTAQTSANTP